MRQLSDDGPQSIDREAREQPKELVSAFEDTFAMDENELGCAQDVAHTIDTTKNRTEGERGTKEEERQGKRKQLKEKEAQTKKKGAGRKRKMGQKAKSTKATTDLRGDFNKHLK